MIPMTSDAQRDERRSPDARRLEAIAARAAAVDGVSLQLVFDDEGMGLEIVRPVMAGGKPIGHGAPEPFARFAHDAGNDEATALAAAPEDLGFLLCLIRRAAEKVRGLERQIADLRAALDVARSPKQSTRSGADYTTEAAMKLKDDALFRVYLCGRDDGVEAADAKLKERLGITSKKDLNTDGRAASLWRSTVRDYEKEGRRP